MSTVVPPEQIDALVDELHQAAKRRDPRALEQDVSYLLGEAYALDRALTALSQRKLSPEGDATIRAKRAPFLELAMKITESERNKVYDELLTDLTALRSSNG